MAYRNYSTAVSHIVDTTGQGDFTTIAAAITAASAGQTIFIRPGTYTENPTLKAGVNLVASLADALTPNVTIAGKCTFTAAGTVSISGIQLQTNSDFCLAVTGSSASIVNLKSCYINALNNTAISFTSSSASSQINTSETSGNLGTTGIALFSHSSAGIMKIHYGEFLNSGSSTTANTVSGTGQIFIDWAILSNPITSSSSSSVQIYNSDVVPATNNIAFTCGGTGTNVTYLSSYGGGTASAISISGSCTLTVASSTVSSSNTNAITGAGTLQFAAISFTGTSSTINTTTQTPLITRPSFSTKNQVFTGSGTYTPTTGMSYCQITCVGGGAGGGGTAATGAGQSASAAGGGAGGYSSAIVTAAQVGASQTVTVGGGGNGATAGNNTGTAGTDTSVGSLVVAKGGSGGPGSGAGAASGGPGGAGGVAASGTGDVKSSGGVGGTSFGSFTGAVNVSGYGGTSFFGSGAGGVITGASNAAAGTNAVAATYGSGGSGGSAGASQSATAGGNGAAGVVIIQEYILS